MRDGDVSLFLSISKAQFLLAFDIYVAVKTMLERAGPCVLFSAVSDREDNCGRIFRAGVDRLVCNDRLFVERPGAGFVGMDRILGEVGGADVNAEPRTGFQQPGDLPHLNLDFDNLAGGVGNSMRGTVPVSEGGD